MLQDIPSSCTYSHELCKIDLKGEIDIDWREMHREHSHIWDRRAENLFVADLGDGVSDAYHSWYSSITLRYITRIGGGHSYKMDLLDHLESVYKGEIVGDIPGIIANVRRVLKDQFSSGYYQDFPFEERRAKEVELKGKPKRLLKGDRARVNPPWRRGVFPNVHGEEAHVDENIGDHVQDKGSVHLVHGEEAHVDENIGDPVQDEGSVHLDYDNEDEAEAREAEIDLSVLDGICCHQTILS